MIEALRREIARDMARETVRDITLDPSVATVGGEILGRASSSGSIHGCFARRLLEHDGLNRGVRRASHVRAFLRASLLGSFLSTFGSGARKHREARASVTGLFESIM